jgi:cation diffusion facilitator CzcD-associated flavoprotein CzcO
VHRQPDEWVAKPGRSIGVRFHPHSTIKKVRPQKKFDNKAYKRGNYCSSFLMGSVSKPAGSFNVKKIAIIGAGPSGLAAAKFLVAERAFDIIDIFEQQSQVGGVWNYTPHIAGPIPVPQDTPHAPLDPPIWSSSVGAPLFSNPMYEQLNTNIPKTLMQFSDLDFPSKSLLFPTREDVQDYLVKYAQDIRHLISFSQQVEDVRLMHYGWDITIKSTITKETRRANYDAIVIANGHYSVPYIPSVQGIEAFNAAYPSIIQHSKLYRSPAPFVGKKVIVVGSAASGLVRTIDHHVIIPSS